MQASLRPRGFSVQALLVGTVVGQFGLVEIIAIVVVLQREEGLLLLARR
jgi:hypothetical protein